MPAELMSCGPHAVLSDFVLGVQLVKQAVLVTSRHGVQFQGEVLHAIKLEQIQRVVHGELGVHVLHLDVNVLEGVHGVQTEVEVVNVRDYCSFTKLQHLLIYMLRICRRNTKTCNILGRKSLAQLCEPYGL